MCILHDAQRTRTDPLPLFSRDTMQQAIKPYSYFLSEFVPDFITISFVLTHHASWYPTHRIWDISTNLASLKIGLTTEIFRKALIALIIFFDWFVVAYIYPCCTNNGRLFQVWCSEYLPSRILSEVTIRIWCNHLSDIAKVALCLVWSKNTKTVMRSLFSLCFLKDISWRFYVRILILFCKKVLCLFLLSYLGCCLTFGVSFCSSNCNLIDLFS